MTCPQCQAVTESGSAFCAHCGSPLAAAPAGPGPVRPAAQPPGFGSGPSAAPGVTGFPPPSFGPHDQRVRAMPPAAAEPFRLDMKRLSSPERLVGGASIVVLIALFLPWFGFSAFGSSVSVSGVTAHGYLYIGLIVTLAILAYLVLRAGWDAIPLTLPIAPGPLLLIGTGLQFLIVVIAFLDKPAILSWDIGAYLALIAAIAAAAPVIVPAVRSLQGNN